MVQLLMTAAAKQKPVSNRERLLELAEQLVLQTIKGSASFYEQAGRHPATLRNQVTSPGGTSAEALYYLEKAGFRTAISRAVWAAYQRSLELGKEKPGHIDTNDEEK